jgi:hypothetical protein
MQSYVKIGKPAPANVRPLVLPSGMRRARKILDEAYHRFLAKPGNDTFSDRYFSGAVKKAGDCYLLHGHEQKPPEEWPFPTRDWRPTWIRQNALKKAGILYRAALAVSVSQEFQDDYTVCMRELEAVLPALPPSRPYPQQEKFEDCLFDLETVRAYGANHSTLAAVLGMHPEHLKPHPKLRIEHKEITAEIPIRLKIPFSYRPLEKSDDRPSPGEHGMVGYFFDRRKSAVREGEPQKLVMLVGYATTPEGKPMAFFPDRGWMDASMDLFTLTSIEVSLKAKEKPYATEMWQFHIPSSNLSTDEQPV